MENIRYPIPLKVAEAAKRAVRIEIKQSYSYFFSTPEIKLNKASGNLTYLSVGFVVGQTKLIVASSTQFSWIQPSNLPEYSYAEMVSLEPKIFDSQGKEYEIVRYHVDEARGLALIELKNDLCDEPLHFGDTEKLRQYESVWTAQYPAGENGVVPMLGLFCDFQNFKDSSQYGDARSVLGDFPDEKFLRIFSKSNPYSVGSPVLDYDGNLVGMYRRQGYDGDQFFALTSESIHRFLDEYFNK